VFEGIHDAPKEDATKKILEGMKGVVDAGDEVEDTNQYEDSHNGEVEQLRLHVDEASLVQDER